MDDEIPVSLDSEENQDPYLDYETGILFNLLDVTTLIELKAIEAQAVLDNIDEAMAHLQSQPLLTFEAWKDVHRILFRDVYEWAGCERSVNLGRENKIVFNTARDIVRESVAVLHRIADGKDFRRTMGSHYAELNFQHPFREGNGRTLKCLFSEMARRNGLLIDWARIDPDAYTDALTVWQRSADPAEIQAVLDGCTRSLTASDADIPLGDHLRQADVFSSFNFKRIR